MGMTFSIGGVAYADNGPADGKHAMGISVGSPGQDIKRFHAPGTDGNLVIRGGRVGQSIVCIIRYIGTVAGSRALYRADKDAFANTAVTIIDDESYSHTNCNLLDMKESGPMQATGLTNGQVSFDVVASFTRDS